MSDSMELAEKMVRAISLVSEAEEPEAILEALDEAFEKIKGKRQKVTSPRFEAYFQWYGTNPPGNPYELIGEAETLEEAFGLIRDDFEMREWSSEDGEYTICIKD